MSGTFGAIVWLVIAAVLSVIEGLTVQLVCIWFAFGALAAMAASFCGASFEIQLALFLIVSTAVLIFGRPVLKRRLIPKRTPTNADSVIGTTGIVIGEINNTLQTGRVSANGLDWTARTSDGSVVSEGQTVTVLSIEGVKLIVEPIKEVDLEKLSTDTIKQSERV